MNYYEHHIGDYAQATSHLTFVEDAAYSRLIRKYYAEEKPIPADLKAAQRLVGARTREEREAVEAVLSEFFVLKDDGWHSKRCDAEIGAYRQKQEKARASANARWEKNHAKAMRTHAEGDANASGDKPCDGNANASKAHDERNALQTPDTRQKEKDSPRTIDPSTPREYATAAGEACARLRSEAGMVSTNPSHPDLLAALAAGVTPDELVNLALEYPKKPLAYVAKAALGRRQDAAQQAAGGTHGSPQARCGEPESAVARAHRQNAEHRAQREAGSGRIIEHGS